MDKVIRNIFNLTRTASQSEVIGLRYQEKMRERKNLLDRVRKEYTKATDELSILKSEVVKAIRGESSFSQEMLSTLISEAGTRCAELQDQFEAAKAAYEEGKEVLEDLNNQFNQIVSWSEMYDSASQETKKMIASHLIKRVDVYRNYKLHIEFNIDYERFCSGLDVSPSAG